MLYNFQEYNKYILFDFTKNDNLKWLWKTNWDLKYIKSKDIGIYYICVYGMLYFYKKFQTM